MHVLNKILHVNIHVKWMNGGMINSAEQYNSKSIRKHAPDNNMSVKLCFVLYMSDSSSV